MLGDLTSASRLAQQAQLQVSPVIRLAEEMRALHAPSLALAEEFKAMQLAIGQPALAASAQLNAFRDSLRQSSSTLANEFRAIQQAFQQPAAVSAFGRMHEEMGQVSEALSQLVRPDDGGLAIIGRNLAEIIKPLPAIMDGLKWEETLTARMQAIDAQWAMREHIELATLGFAHMSRLSDAARAQNPFSERVSELFTEELGSSTDEYTEQESAEQRDEIAVSLGMNATLLAFPPESYGQVVLSAGFRFNVKLPAAPKTVNGGSGDAVFDPNHGAVLTTLEQNLRDLVETTLSKICGSRWIRQRVSETVRKKWEQRQQEDVDLGRPVYGPIQYADFMDLADIIAQKDNWSDAFEAIFKQKEEIVVSLRRLHPVRKAIAHSRPLSRSDVLYLVSEATRVFTALGTKLN